MKKVMECLTFVLMAAALGLFMIPVWVAFAGPESFSSFAAPQAITLAGGLTAIEDSHAYQQYRVRKKSELSKLVYLMDRFKGTGFKVLYDGREYDSDQAALESRKYLAKNYKQEPAEDWVRRNAYRSSPAGNVIQVRTPEGDLQLLRDLLLGELESLKHVETRLLNSKKSS